MLARLALVTLIAVIAVPVLAIETSRLSLPPEYQRGDITKPQGWWPLIGVGMGVMDAGDQVRSGGVPTHVKVLGSYYFDSTPWVADAGLGLHNEFLTQDGSGSDTIQSFYSEFSARYQLTNRWQLGAIWNTLIDNPQRYKSNNDNLVSFVGAQILKEFNWNEQYLVRAGGRVMTDVGIGGETINTIMGELQVSFGGAQQTAMTEPLKAAPVVIESVSLMAPETRPSPVAPHLARAASQTFKLEPGPIHFESESSELVFGSEPYLRRLAHALALNRQLFDKVEIVAHATTPKGSAPLSKKLSASRADVVARQFIAAGINQAQVKTLAESVRTATAHTKGRVELRFSGVRNETALRNILNSVAR